MEKDTAILIVKIYAVIAWISAFTGLLLGIGFMSGGSFLSFLGGAMMTQQGMLTSLFGTLAAVLGVVFILIAIFDAIVGYGLWNFKPWARTVAIIMSVLSLFSFPIGTIVGIIGIWLFGFEPTVKSLFGKTAKKKR